MSSSSSSLSRMPLPQLLATLKTGPSSSRLSANVRKVTVKVVDRGRRSQGVRDFLSLTAPRLAFLNPHTTIHVSRMPSTTPTNRVKDPSEISKRIKEQATAAESVSEEDGKAGKEQVIVVEMDANDNTSGQPTTTRRIPIDDLNSSQILKELLAVAGER